MSYLEVDVPGLPIPQGSMRLVQGGKRMIHSNPKLTAWRADVYAHTIAAIIRAERQTPARFPLTGPCVLRVTFAFPRPKHHYRTGRYADQLRDNAPRLMQTGPDLDKLVRAIGDALTDAAAIVDDKQICTIDAAKGWAVYEPAAYITLRSVNLA